MHCPHAGARCPLEHADPIGKTLIKLLALTRLLMSSTASGGGSGNAPASLAKGLGGTGQHHTVSAQPGASVPKGDLIPVPKPESHLCSGDPGTASPAFLTGHRSSEPPGISVTRVPGLCCPLTPPSPPPFPAAQGFGMLVPNTGGSHMCAHVCTSTHTCAHACMLTPQLATNPPPFPKSGKVTSSFTFINHPPNSTW